MREARIHNVNRPPSIRFSAQCRGVMRRRLQLRTQYPGTGIGLTVVRRAVERMNGRIQVESEVGAGTTVCVELPRA